MSLVTAHSQSIPSPRPVLPLPPSTRSLLRSAPLLSSLPQCVAELVENALDAAASHVHVLVDCARLSLSVADDGRGMDGAEMERCGVRHWTTKGRRRGERGRCVFGARGEALASLADIATVDITSTAATRNSRHRQPRTYHKRLSSSSSTAVTALAPSTAQSHGTTIAVTRLYSSLPVRRRLLLSRRDRERELIKRCVERISLVHRHVVFTVWDDEHRRQLLSKGRLTDLPSSFGELYRPDLAAGLLPVMRRDEAEVGVRLYVSSLTAGYHTRDYQFVYVNRRSVVHPTLQRLIGQCWQRCRLFMDGGPTPAVRVMHAVFVLLLEVDDNRYDCLLQSDKQLVVMADEDAVTDAVRSCLRTGLVSEYAVLQERASELFGDSVDGDDGRGRVQEVDEDSKEGGEKENDAAVASGALIDLTGDVTVHLPSRAYSHLADTCGTATRLPSAAEAAGTRSHARRSLSSFNYAHDRAALPSMLSSATVEAAASVSVSVLSSPPSPYPRALLDVEDNEERAEQRVSSNASAAYTALQEEDMQSQAGGSECEAAADGEVEEQVSSFPLFSPRPGHGDSHTSPVRGSKRRRADVEAKTRKVHKPIDLTGEDRSVHCARTPTTVPQAPPPPPMVPSPAVLSIPRPVNASRPSARSLQLSFDEGEHDAPTGHAVPLVNLSDVHVAAPAAQPTTFDPTTQRFLFSQADRLSFPSHAVIVPRSSSPSRPPVLSLQKRLLQQARVVGQVDRMYVLCLLDNRHLVAVDQHAADERVRLEDLEAHIAQLVGSQPLAQPLQSELTPIEAGALELYRQQVHRWGWRISHSNGQPAHTVTITHCPALLLPPTASLDSAVPLHDYLAQLSRSLRCPSHSQLPDPLLSLLHSRACKSAIRFGDRLSAPQQAALVAALSRCQLPFQCAHGRPSMQPLVQLSQQTQAQGQGQSSELAPRWWKEQVRKELGPLTVVRERQETVEEL